MDTQEEEMESFRKENLGDRETDYDGARGFKPIGGMRARSLYDTDLEDANRCQRGRRRHHSTHELTSGNWLYIVDNDLPLTLSKNTDLWEDLQQQPAITKLCQDCSSFRLLSQPPQGDIEKLTVDVAKLRAAVDSCDLCKLFHRRLAHYKLGNEEMVEVFRDCSVLKVDEHSRPLLTILGDPGLSSCLIAGKFTK
jgi:hypothetical protein